MVKEDDLVLICGDISWGMKLNEAKADLDLIATLPGKKVMIRGNHEYWWQGIGKVRAILPEGMFAIQNDAIRFENLVICGTRGWTSPDTEFSEEDAKLYAREIERLKISLDKMQKLRQEDDQVICMLHFPPFNVRRERNAMLELIESYDVDFVCYGHLHGKDVRAERVLKICRTKYFLTACDQIGFSPIQIL
jgi:predicted phosphohydrolase